LRQGTMPPPPRPEVTRRRHRRRPPFRMGQRLALVPRVALPVVQSRKGPVTGGPTIQRVSPVVEKSQPDLAMRPGRVLATTRSDAGTRSGREMEIRGEDCLARVDPITRAAGVPETGCRRTCLAMLRRPGQTER
jgi:hypothetical protein